MFCSSCGKELPAESRFCNACGTPIVLESKGINQIEKPFVSDDEIRMELKKCRKNTPKAHLCLECGYNGIMGVSTQKVEKRWIIKGIIYTGIEIFITWFIIGTNTPPVGVWGGTTWSYRILGAVIVFTWIYLSRKCWICPSCKQVLAPKKF